VAHCEKKGLELQDLELKDLKKFSSSFGPDAPGCLSVEASIRSRKTPGGTAPSRVKAAMRAATGLLDKSERFVKQEIKKTGSLLSM
jgi:argininosuccinate lyase